MDSMSTLTIAEIRLIERLRQLRNDGKLAVLIYLDCLALSTIGRVERIEEVKTENSHLQVT